MGSSEGSEIGRRLKKDGWKVRYNRSTNQWTAVRRDACAPLLWKKDANLQRILKEARAALGQPPVRTRSGEKVKQRAAQQRQRAVDEAERHRKAVAAVQLFNAPRRLLTTSAQRRFRELELTSTAHALVRAQERGITGAQVQDALVSPLEIATEKTNTCAVFVGRYCRVAVDPRGNIVTVMNV